MDYALTLQLTSADGIALAVDRGRMPESDLSESDALLEGVRRRAPDAFRRLYQDNARGLKSFAHSFLRDPASAEDAVQHAFLDLVKSAAGLHTSPRAWLYKAVRYRCLDELRRRKRRREALFAEVPEPAPEPPADSFLDLDMEQALAQLTDGQR
jgi:RNA polymerase sigma factor (sigma-70 family)